MTEGFEDAARGGSVTVMIRPADDETTTRYGRPLAQAGTRRRRWTGFVCEVKSLQWQRLQRRKAFRGCDGVMASLPPPRRRWLPEGAGAAFQHVLTASTVGHVRIRTYDQAEHWVPYAYESGLRIARLL